MMSIENQTRCCAKLTGARAHYQLSRFDRDQFVQSDLIITIDGHVGSLEYLQASKT